MKQSYPQVVFWCLSGLSNPVKKTFNISPTIQTVSLRIGVNTAHFDWFTIFKEQRWNCGSGRKEWRRCKLPVLHEL